MYMQYIHPLTSHTAPPFTYMPPPPPQLFTCGRGEYGRLGLGDQKSHLTMVPVDGMEVRNLSHRQTCVYAYMC